MGEVVALFGFQWVAVVTLLFADDEYDLPDLCIGPFFSLGVLKSWKRKFLKCLGRKCSKMPNILACAVDYEQEEICNPETYELSEPRNPPDFAREFLALALRSWTENQSRRKIYIKTAVMKFQK